jgi:hypothetical protein
LPGKLSACKLQDCRERTPLGHWTEDTGAVHIQWNIGKPSDLAKNGAELDAPGERCTPYKLADGEILQGTFVRKMEAGLRSQAIVLKPDGTFVGDGVNLTMGRPHRESSISGARRRRLRNPQRQHHSLLPERFHPGNRLCFGQNAFGDVKTVLLNGFPFERVR